MRDIERYTLWTNLLTKCNEALSNKPIIIDTHYDKNEQYNIIELRTFCKLYNISGFSKLKKGELLEKLNTYIDNNENKLLNNFNDKIQIKSSKLTINNKNNNKNNTQQIIYSDLSLLHKKYKTMNSKTLHKQFVENPQLHAEYHKIAKHNEKSFNYSDIPRNKIINKLENIKTRTSKHIVDMGCGYAEIYEHFKNNDKFVFYNYDHVSINDNIISCDISNLPIEDNIIDIAILSLALWGSNCEEYIREAYRILETNGILYIIEPTKRWTYYTDIGEILDEPGLKLQHILQDNKFTIIQKEINKFCLFVCIKI